MKRAIVLEQGQLSSGAERLRLKNRLKTWLRGFVMLSWYYV